MKRGRLHPIERGVYAVGRRELSREGRWMAAVLGCGASAVLSHSSAAELWGIGRELRGCVEISVPFASPRRRPGIRVHRRPKLRADDVTERCGIPVTAPIRTIVDRAARTDEAGLERLVNEADKLGLVDPITLHAAPTQQARDRRRDQAHTAAGYAHLRFTHAQVRYEADDVRATLLVTIRRLEAQARHAAAAGRRGAAA